MSDIKICEACNDKYESDYIYSGYCKICENREKESADVHCPYCRQGYYTSDDICGQDEDDEISACCLNCDREFTYSIRYEINFNESRKIDCEQECEFEKKIFEHNGHIKYGCKNCSNSKIVLKK